MNRRMKGKCSSCVYELDFHIFLHPLSVKFVKLLVDHIYQYMRASLDLFSRKQIFARLSSVNIVIPSCLLEAVDY